MREILFKAKTESGIWIEGNLIHYQSGEVAIIEKQFSKYGYEATEISRRTLVLPDTICQYTGLTDKNGNKIWENDIVDFLGHKGRVKYEFGSFGIAYIECIDWEEIESNICPVTGCDNALCACENDNYISLWEIYWNFNDEDDCLSTIEVIGNIFDNACIDELLADKE